MKTKKKTKVKVSCVQCPECLDIIYSRARHDFHYCSCKGVFIDGGFDYKRCGGIHSLRAKHFNKFIMGVDKKDLYDDWSNRKDKYGVIKNDV